MSLRTYTIERTVRTTRTATIQMDESLYQRALDGNTAARNKICILVRESLRLSGYVAWGSFTITPDKSSGPSSAGVCDDCAWCDTGNHHQCRKCSL